jgi:hypothetical protein
LPDVPAAGEVVFGKNKTKLRTDVFVPVTTGISDTALLENVPLSWELSV